MERLQEALDLDTGERLVALYGPGVQDTFISSDFIEMNLEAALHRHLRSHGFERIVYHRPDRDIYFLDEQSRDLVRLVPAARGRSQRKQGRFDGPLGKVMLMGARSAAPQDTVAVGGALSARLLDRLFREPAPRTAIVFFQIEQVLERMMGNPTVSDTLKTVISTWLGGLPMENQNLCVIVFSVSGVSPVPRNSGIIYRGLVYQRWRSGLRPADDLLYGMDSASPGSAHLVKLKLIVRWTPCVYATVLL
jgi:hypothetical protein